MFDTSRRLLESARFIGPITDLWRRATTSGLIVIGSQPTPRAQVELASISHEADFKTTCQFPGHLPL